MPRMSQISEIFPVFLKKFTDFRKMKIMKWKTFQFSEKNPHKTGSHRKFPDFPILKNRIIGENFLDFEFSCILWIIVKIKLYCSEEAPLSSVLHIVFLYSKGNLQKFTPFVKERMCLLQLL